MILSEFASAYLYLKWLGSKNLFYVYPFVAEMLQIMYRVAIMMLSLTVNHEWIEKHPYSKWAIVIIISTIFVSVWFLGITFHYFTEEKKAIEKINKMY